MFVIENVLVMNLWCLIILYEVDFFLVKQTLVLPKAKLDVLSCFWVFFSSPIPQYIESFTSTLGTDVKNVFLLM